MQRGASAARARVGALFTRGETQALSLITLGTTEDSQEIDAYTGGDKEKQFILHYNFPNFSVGETGRIAGPGRREIGHGALAERSIEPMVPLKEFPYAVRITSEIMESNGSHLDGHGLRRQPRPHGRGRPPRSGRSPESASVSAPSTVPPARSPATQLLTDIIGSEDFFCDMDCKIAGTEKGMTGFQLDLKLKGLPHHLMAEAIEKARLARLKILGIMAETIAEPAQGTEQVRAAHPDAQDQSREDRRAHRPGRQEHQTHRR